MKNTIKTGALAAAALAATLAATAADAADRVRWRMHSSYAEALPVAGKSAYDIGRAIKEISDGDFDIRVFEPGALVGGAAYYDAVSQGSIDAAYGSPGFNAGKNSAYSFFASVPFGPGAGEYMAWLRHGGGTELAQEIYARDNIHFIPCGLLPPETSGWFKKEIRSAEDLKGLKMRFLGLGAKVMEKFGVSTQLLAPGEIYQALELGTLDATEMSIPAIDNGLGFYQIAKYNYFPGWHQQSTVQELLVNMDSWNKLSDGRKKMVEMACDMALMQQFADGEFAEFGVLKKYEENGVHIMTWPDEMLAQFKTAWEEVVAEEAASNPDSAKVWKSLTAFREDYKIWGDTGYLKN